MMFVSFKALPLLGLAAAWAATSAAQAQWYSALGPAPAEAIVQRLHAQNYTLMGPLRRNQRVYLADVIAGATGRERLVIDAYSGEILQRFVAMPRSLGPAIGGYVLEGGEFSAPITLGPPPAPEFYSAYGAPSDFATPSPVAPVGPREAEPKPKPRPQKPAEMKRARSTTPSEQAAKAPEAGAASKPPASAAATAPSAPTSAPAAVPDKATAGTPAAPTETQPRNAARPQPAAAPQPAEKGSSTRLKVNDVPVNPLE